MDKETPHRLGRSLLLPPRRGRGRPKVCKMPLSLRSPPRGSSCWEGSEEPALGFEHEPQARGSTAGREPRDLETGGSSGGTARSRGLGKASRAGQLHGLVLARDPRRDSLSPRLRTSQPRNNQFIGSFSKPSAFPGQ